MVLREHRGNGDRRDGSAAGHSDAAGTPPARADSVRHVRDALAHLYDLAYLQTHPLALLLRPPPAGYAAPTAPAKALRQRLLEAIDALRPASEEVSAPARPSEGPSPPSAPC